jgi:hypothetical protein
MNARKLALEVVLMWEGAPQRAELWESPAVVTVGDEDGATFVLPREAVSRSFTLAESCVGDDAWLVRIPVGADALIEVDEAAGTRVVGLDTLPCEPDGTRLLRCALGGRARLTLGAFSFFVRATTPAEKTQAAPLFHLADHRWLIASVGVHAMFLIGMFFMPPSSSALTLDTDEQRSRMLRYSLEADVIPPPEPDPILEEQSEPAATNEGRAAAGEAGTAGARQETRRTGGGMRAAGTSTDNRIPLTAAEARSAGILGALASLRLNTISSPFGAAEAMGSSLDEAYGSLMGDGFSSGTGGLAMYGTGRGGGCTTGTCGYGTYGVGNLDTVGGTGGCSAEDFARLVAQYGRSGAMDRCSGTGQRVGSTDLTRTGRVPPPPPRPTVTTTNGLSREAIRRTVQRHLAEVRHCYEQRLITRPDLEGRVAVQFVVAPNGSVMSAVTDSTRSDLGDAATSSCIEQAVSRWAFTPSEGVTSVSYPFVFARSE